MEVVYKTYDSSGNNLKVSRVEVSKLKNLGGAGITSKVLYDLKKKGRVKIIFENGYAILER